MENDRQRRKKGKKRRENSKNKSYLLKLISGYIEYSAFFDLEFLLGNVQKKALARRIET